MQNRIPNDKVKDYMLAGKACIILYNITTGTFVKFWLTVKKVDGVVTSWWIYTNPEKTEYIGYIMKNDTLRLRYPDKDMVNTQSAGIVAMEWFWPRLLSGTLPNTVAVLHNGYCGRCGRELTNPESLITGLGPECAKLV